MFQSSQQDERDLRIARTAIIKFFRANLGSDFTAQHVDEIAHQAVAAIVADERGRAA